MRRFVRHFVPGVAFLDSGFSGLEVLHFSRYRDQIDSIVNYSSTSLLLHSMLS